MNKLLFLLICFSFVATFSLAQSRDELTVREILHQQTISWNQGNLEQFMSGYWQNDSLMFIGKRGLTYGWQATLDNYKKNYPDTTSMGKLHFDLLEVKRLSVMYFFVVGKWHLTRSIGNIEGAFTLLVKKINNRWVIVTDHSS